jgi:hypothetical protein
MAYRSASEVGRQLYSRQPPHPTQHENDRSVPDSEVRSLYIRPLDPPPLGTSEYGRIEGQVP